MSAVYAVHECTLLYLPINHCNEDIQRTAHDISRSKIISKLSHIVHS